MPQHVITAFMLHEKGGATPFRKPDDGAACRPFTGLEGQVLRICNQVRVI